MPRSPAWFSAARRAAPRPLLLASALAALALAAAPAAAVVLDFNASSSLNTQQYGDIPGLLDVSHAYQLGAISAPLAWWSSGYDELIGVAWGSQQAEGTVGRLTLAALDPTRPVVLNGFQLGSWEATGAGRTERVTITRIGEASSAFSFIGLIGVGNQASSFAPALDSATGFVIEWTNPWWTAIDNVDIGFGSAVPEAGTASLWGAGLALGVLLHRRQRRHAAAHAAATATARTTLGAARTLRTLALLAATVGTSLAAHAGLTITGLFISASALVTPPDGQTHGNTWFWDDTLGLPVQVVSSGIQHQGLAAGARQTPDGFFYDKAAFTQDWNAPSGLSTLRARTDFKLSVTTDTPDTPLILDFQFLGSQIGAGAHYASGRMTLGTSITISSGLLGTPRVTQWQFEDQLQIGVTSASWQRQSNGVDRQGIGLPLVSDSSFWHQFELQGTVERQAFTGRLDFGLLQPGQVFTLHYDATSWIESDIPYAGFGSAELVDPFSLGGTPPAQLQLQGLTLPIAAVPEPGTGLTLLAGLLAIGALLRRRLAATAA